MVKEDVEVLKAKIEELSAKVAELTDANDVLNDYITTIKDTISGSEANALIKGRVDGFETTMGILEPIINNTFTSGNAQWPDIYNRAKQAFTGSK